MYLMKTWGVPDVGTASWVRHSFLSDGTWISPWEVFNILWKLMRVKPYQSLAFLQSKLKWVWCTQNLFAKCRNSSHIMRSRNLPSELSATALQGARNKLWYPLEANLLGNRNMFWLISWSHKGHCYANNYLQHFSWKWLLETNCSFKSNFGFLLKRKKPEEQSAEFLLNNRLLYLS